MDGDWWWMALAMAVFWAAIIVLVVWVFRSGGGVSVHRRESADEILRRRLAEGEISVEEFETRRKAMREGGGGET
ncbi:MAG: SHOCT domain-containing protein [Actinobacteria bacterium]|nr:SHOCT domain-containing protein [Actinomycetota bacterium]